MGVFSKLFTSRPAARSGDGGRRIDGAADLDRAIRSAGTGTAAGMSVTADTSMRTAAVFACVRIISGAVANMPLHVKRRVDDLTRVDQTDHPLWKVLRKKPNGWQTPSQFRRMLTAHLLLRGNAYAQIVMSRGRVIALNPLNPDRMEVQQGDDLRLVYTYTRRDGRKVKLAPQQVLHLVGLTLDGVTGVSVITYARESIGLSMAQERHGATTFRNSARPSIVMKHPKQLGEEGLAFLRASLDDYRQGGDSEGKALILEEGMEVDRLSMTAEDAQWIEGRKFSRSDIAMFFGVPPHMIGDTEKSTSWGSGIEQQGQGFVTYTLEDHLTCWEETIARDLIPDAEMDIYVRFNRRALLRGDSKARSQYYQSGLQWGWMSPDEVRSFEDMNPRPDGQGHKFNAPPNTAGRPAQERDDDDQSPSGD